MPIIFLHFEFIFGHRIDKHYKIFKRLQLPIILYNGDMLFACKSLEVDSFFFFNCKCWATINFLNEFIEKLKLKERVI